ncbi:hypothetical protein E4U23_008127 [Claviceps purpurea]|nr:hypothetical protein E4U23_008127 [Claviceps purpurea]
MSLDGSGGSIETPDIPDPTSSSHARLGIPPEAMQSKQQGRLARRIAALHYTPQDELVGMSAEPNTTTSASVH